MIVVSTPVPVPEKVFCISAEEARIVQRVFDAFGRVDAIRVARAFAKSDLHSAVTYTGSLTRNIPTTGV